MAFDDDNLAGSCRALRHALAEILTADDGDARVRWRPRQKRSTQAVRVTLTGSHTTAGKR